MPSFAVGCSALAAAVVLMGSQGLETAIANGDTRTISLHHIHTNEDITITFKRDGRYDEDALKKLNWFVRDWRKQEETSMDPRLFDLVWEASREVGGNKVIHVVCGYRSPATNAMLHARSSGVAEHSQHTLGKAMDFFIPGASLEELRNVGLRLQRGGVGYYPTSGSPFVHLDVANVRHWGPPIGDAEMAKIMSGRATRLAAADAPPSATSRSATPVQAKAGQAKVAQAAPVQTKPVQAAAQAKPPAPAAGTYTVASLESRPADLGRPAKLAAIAATPVPHERPKTAAAPAEDVRTAAAAPAPDRMRLASVTPAKASASEINSGVMWPVRVAENDRVPLDMALGFAPAQSPVVATAMRPDPSASVPARVAAPVTRISPPRANTTMAVTKKVVRTAAADQVSASAGGDALGAEAMAPESAGTAEPIAASAPEPFPVTSAAPVGGTTITTKVVANTGMRYDDPWLRAMIMCPSLVELDDGDAVRPARSHRAAQPDAEAQLLADAVVHRGSVFRSGAGPVPRRGGGLPEQPFGRPHRLAAVITALPAATSRRALPGDFVSGSPADVGAPRISGRGSPRVRGRSPTPS